MVDDSELDDISKNIEEMEAKILDLRTKLKTVLRDELKDKTIHQVKKLLKKLSDNDLKLFYDNFLPEEDHDICQAINEILKARYRKSLE